MSELNKLATGWQKASEGLMQLGWYAAHLKRTGGFVAAGFLSEADCRDQLGVGLKTWGKMCRIANALQLLPYEQFLRLPPENADILSRLPEDQRYSEEVLRLAEEKTPVELEKFLLTQRSIEEKLPVQDLRVRWTLSLHEGQKRAIQQTVEEFRMALGITDNGTALEWLVMEYHHRKTVVETMMRIVPLLKKARQSDSIEKMRETIEEVVLQLADAVKVLKERE